MDYYNNIKNEQWLSGLGNMNLKQRLYLFVKYGGYENGTS